MTEIFKLENPIKHYEWGSPDYIPRLLGAAPDGSPSTDGEPWAELWMGSHPGGPSLAQTPEGKIALGDLIAGDPRRYLGEETACRYGALPFLFKLLAAGKPLSIQAHPDLARAREGYERENRAGLAPDAPNRNYRDPNHKLEIICALTPFTGLCGFREPDEIRNLLEIFISQRRGGTESCALLTRDSLSFVSSCLSERSSGNKLKNFLEALFGLSQTERQALTEYILVSAPPREEIGTDSSVEWELMREFAELYPGDPAVIAPLYLNVFRLEPGEAVFLRAGILHAYCRGFGVELMTNSDNVLRGGLTAKHIDIPELLKVADFNPMTPEILKPEPDLSCFTYLTPCGEFSLSVMRGGANAAAWPPTALAGPSIGIVTQGELSIGELVLKQGESAFFSPAANGEGWQTPRGNFTLYIASVRCTASPGETAPCKQGAPFRNGDENSH